MQHKRAVHEGVKHPYEKCNYQPTSKGNHAQHERSVHEGVKFPCGQCNYRETSKDYLAKHKRALMKELDILVNNATIK